MIIKQEEMFSLNSKICDVIRDEAFTGFGHLLFPVHRHISPSMTLQDLGKVLIWYSHIESQRTVSIVNEVKLRVLKGEQIFYDIYNSKEKNEEPDKKNTGLFFFRGKPRGKTAIISAGGGFTYVAAMHDSFPHAQELSKAGYNAFALIYRPESRKACEDLSRAIAFIHNNAEELQVDVSDYSLWGGSAGARMSAWTATYGTHAFGERPYPQPAAVIMEYTGLSEVTGKEPPTYNCVGTSDSIAWYHTMEERIKGIRAYGIDAEIEVFPGLAHGFGLGEGTVAEGWLNRAIGFWQRQMKG